MKTGFLATGMMFLAGVMPATGVLAAEPGEALCRGGYPVTLMTDRECRLYIQQVQALRSTGQVQALANLQQQHAEQLKERAAACPCMEPSPKAVAPQHVVMRDPDC